MLVPDVDIGALVPVHLHGDEVVIDDPGDLGILVRLAVDDVAPVAPHGADVEQDRLVLRLRPSERLVAPGIPLHRLVGGGPEIGACSAGKSIGHACLLFIIPDRVGISAI